MTLCPGAAFAGAAEGQVITCIGYGPKTVPTITGPRTALMLVEEADSAFPTIIRDAASAKVFRIAPKMLLQ